jgi:hypothetical protein
MRNAVSGVEYVAWEISRTRRIIPTVKRSLSSLPSFSGCNEGQADVLALESSKHAELSRSRRGWPIELSWAKLG